MRTTPYELVFGAGALEGRLDDIRSEARSRQLLVDEPAQLIMLTETGRLLRELIPEDADPTSVLDAGRLIFHAYHFQEADRSTYALDPAVLGRLLEETAEATAGPMLPARAGYLQLPRNAVWARVAEDAPWEAVDGLFWAGAAAPEARALHQLWALLVLGMRPDRPGFSVVAVDGADAPEAGDWSEIEARGDGPDFGNLLPGGELGGLHSLVNEAEVLKLLSRFFRYLAAHPEAVQPEAAGTGDVASARLRRFLVRAPADGR